MARWGQLLAGAALAAALLIWVFHGKDPRGIAVAMARASLLGLAAGSLLNVGHNVFRVLRWQALLEPVRKGIPFRPMFSSIIIGYMTTWIIPGRLGEVVRPALLSAKEDLPLGPCLGSIVADRVLDGAAIVVLFLAGVMAVDLTGEAAAHAARIRTTALLLAGLVAGVLAVLMAGSAAKDVLERWLAGRGRAVRWAGGAFLALAEGTNALRRPRLLPAILAYSVLMWLTIGLGTWIGIRACGASIPFAGVLVILPLLALGVAVPTPGGAGGYHAAMTWGLVSLFGVSGETAAGAGVLMHLGVILPVIVLGLVLLRIERVSFSDLTAAARRMKSLDARAGVASGAGASP